MQINVQVKIKQKKINIVDVLKPADEYIDNAENKCKFFFLNII